MKVYLEMYYVTGKTAKILTKVCALFLSRFLMVVRFTSVLTLKGHVELALPPS